MSFHIQYSHESSCFSPLLTLITYYFISELFYPRRAKRALSSGENSSCLLLIDSEMAGPFRLKPGGMVEGIAENILAKEFLGSVNIDQGQVGRPQVPLPCREDDKETPNWA